MAKKPILVVMAAGMGSRYGGLKQIDPVGSQGEAILDFSLFDAYAAGFETAVIIIKEAIRKDFMDTVGKRLEKCPMEIRYAYQELDKIPEGFTVPAERTKPWGTCHAIMCAKEAIDGAPFAVINADDYYGKSAFTTIYNALEKAADGDKLDLCMVGYLLGNTVTENGSVARGICVTDENNMLITIAEQTRIEMYEGGIHYTEDDGATWIDAPASTVVSMNMWGYTPAMLDELEARFPAFLEKALATNPAKAEFFLPLAVEQLLREEKATVKVLESPDKWYGVTYAADKPQVVAALKEMTEKGLYPDGLWG
ncbi:MAG: nucleotidyltransferase [Oscillospiraceae bacterium]|nr:nucleotidyltransferase [Oscillospiraceae bacterium]MBQ9929795.1 nucleotidyltransferase [Oscillospiraceae bacterium]